PSTWRPGSRTRDWCVPGCRPDRRTVAMRRKSDPLPPSSRHSPHRRCPQSTRATGAFIQVGLAGFNWGDHWGSGDHPSSSSLSGQLVVGIGGPYEGFGVVVDFGEVAVNGGLEIDNATEDAVPEQLPGQFREEPFDRIEPG